MVNIHTWISSKHLTPSDLDNVSVQHPSNQFLCSLIKYVNTALFFLWKPLLPFILVFYIPLHPLPLSSQRQPSAFQPAASQSPHCTQGTAPSACPRCVSFFPAAERYPCWTPHLHLATYLLTFILLVLNIYAFPEFKNNSAEFFFSKERRRMRSWLAIRFLSKMERKIWRRSEKGQ